MIHELEQAIAGRIKESVYNLTQVVEFPDDPETLGRPVMKSRILVGYQRASFQLTANETQEKTFFFEAIFQVKELRSHHIAYELLDEVSLGLTGWRPFSLASRNIYMEDERFVNYSEGVWIYSQTYSLAVSIGDPVRRALSRRRRPRESPEMQAERMRNREAFLQEYMTPVGEIILPPHIEVKTGLWRSKIDEVGSTDGSSLDAVFVTGGMEDLSLRLETTSVRRDWQQYQDPRTSESNENEGDEGDVDETNSL
jgi:hypothetical protein